VQRLSEDRKRGSAGRRKDEGIGNHDRGNLGDKLRGRTLPAAG
jgi:hypothetical protein